MCCFYFIVGFVPFLFPAQPLSANFVRGDVFSVKNT